MRALLRNAIARVGRTVRRVHARAEGRQPRWPSSALVLGARLLQPAGPDAADAARRCSPAWPPPTPARSSTELTRTASPTSSPTAAPRSSVPRRRRSTPSGSQLGGEGLPARDTDGGYALLDKQGITAQRVPAAGRLTSGRWRASSPRPSRSSTASTTAVVHLAMPKKDVFADRASKPTASVLVQDRGGHDARPASRSRLDRQPGLLQRRGHETRPRSTVVRRHRPGAAPPPTTTAAGAGDLRSRETHGLRGADGRQACRPARPGRRPGQRGRAASPPTSTTTTPRPRAAVLADPRYAPLALELDHARQYTGTARRCRGRRARARTTSPMPSGHDRRPAPATAYQKDRRPANNAVDKTNQERQGRAGLGAQARHRRRARRQGGRPRQPAGRSRTWSARPAAWTPGPRRPDRRHPMPFDRPPPPQAADAGQAGRADEQKAGLMKMVRTGALVLVICLIAADDLSVGPAAQAARAASALRRARGGNAVLKRDGPARARAARGHRAPAMPPARARGYDPAAERLAQRPRARSAKWSRRSPTRSPQLLRGWLADRRSRMADLRPRAMEHADGPAQKATPVLR